MWIYTFIAVEAGLAIVSLAFFFFILWRDEKRKEKEDYN